MRNYYTGVHTACGTTRQRQGETETVNTNGIEAWKSRWETQQKQIMDNKTREAELNVKHRWQKTTKVKEEIHNQLTTDSNI